jgi:hypothetical protein
MNNVDPSARFSLVTPVGSGVAVGVLVGVDVGVGLGVRVGLGVKVIVGVGVGVANRLLILDASQDIPANVIKLAKSASLIMPLFFIVLLLLAY